ncbi:MAG TPA: MBG domain-containing protein [Pelomicrobium sp.]|nr:MBG domain-containing protein [Pelomicrobium sp.]
MTRRRIAEAVLLGFGLGHALQAPALPTGGQVTAGRAAISQSGAQMTIRQATPKAAIDWQAFGIGAGESVQFVQPGASAIALNRVLGQDPSVILGRLSANGQVFLLNPNGVLFGSGAQVNVGGIVASTLSLSNDDFMAGSYRFTGASGGTVVNQGTITAAEGGYVALLAPQVANEGVITARLGTVALAAGDQVTLTLSGNQLLSVAVDQDTVGALAANRQLIQADGGQVILTAKARDALLDTVVNNAGVIEARSVSVQNGVVTLDGGPSGITVVSGRIDAGGLAAGETGGRVIVTGDKVALMPGASIDASGDAGGGTVLVGGDWQGGNAAVRNAGQAFVADGALVRADAVSVGDGGKVVVWADGATRYYGDISARGGATGGDGGQVEVSGKQTLDFRGGVDVSAPAGTGGRLLLDPQDIVLNNTAQTPPPNNAPGPPDSAFNDPPAAGATTVEIADVVGYSELYLQATRDITVANDLTMNADGSVRFEAGRDINVNANVTVSGAGTIRLTADADFSGSGGAASNNDGAIRRGAVGNTLTQASGTMQLQGADGVTATVSAPNVTVVNAASGNVDVTNTAAGGAIALGNVASGNLTLATANGAITDTGTVTSSGQINIAAGAAGDVTLDSAANNFANVVVSGRNVTLRDTNAIDFDNGASTVAGNLVVTAGGSVTQQGDAPLSVAGTTTINVPNTADVTLNNAANDFGGAVSVPLANDVTLRDANALVLGPIRTQNNGGDVGSLGVTAAGAITQTGRLDIANTAAFTAGAGNDITLTNPANNFRTSVRIVSGNNVALTDTNALVFGGGTSDVSGDLTLTTGGNVTQTSDLRVAGTATFTAGTANVNLNRAGNRFATVGVISGNNVTLRDGQANLVLAASTVSGNLGITGVGPLTQTGAVTVGGTTALNVGTGNDITLTDAGNDFQTTVRIVNGRNVALTDATGLTFGGGTSNVTGALTAISGGPISQTADLRVTGVASFDAGAGNDITLDRTANRFTTITVVSGRDVSIRENNGNLDLGSMNVSGDLTVVATGNLTDSGTLSVAGDASFKVLNNAARNITLNNAGSTYGTVSVQKRNAADTANSAGTLTVVESGATNAQLVQTTGAANLTASGGVNLGTVNAGSLTVNAGGAVTQTGAATVTGTTSVSSGANPITLDAANDFGGNVTVSNTAGAVRVNDVNNLQLGASSVSTLTAVAGGNLVVNGTLTASGAGDSIVLVAGPVANGTSAFVNNAGAGALAVPVGGRWLIYSQNPALDNRGGLVAGGVLPNLYNRTFNGDPPATITQPGRHFIYAYQPLLTATADDKVKVYGDPLPAFTATITGLVNGDTAAAYTGAPALTTAATATSPVAGSPYAINAAQGTLTSEAGYGFTFVDGQLTVTPRPITVTADDQSKVYGNADPALTVTVGGSGYAPGDSAATVFSGALARAPGETVAGSPYAITQGTLAANGNYSVTTFTDGQLTITQRPITVTADNLNKVYGDPDPALTFAVGGSGLAGGDAIGTVFSGALVRDPGETVAGSPYAINQGTLAANGNYSITAYTAGALTIDARPITVTADAGQTKVYGDPDPAVFTYTLTAGSLVGGDGFSGALDRAAGENAGSYAIQQGTLTAGVNYALTYVGDNFVITPRPITVTADPGQTKVYGEADPLPFGYSLTAGSLVGSDSRTGALDRAAGENVGGYAIQQGTLDASTNYTLSYVGDTFAITARPITVTADAGQTKVYGEADPLPFTYTVTGGPGTTGSAIVAGDSLTGALDRAAGENVGGYAIQQGTLDASAPGNYALTFVPADFVITPATLTYVADPATAFVGTPLPPFSGSVTGFRFADTLGSATAGTLLFTTTASNTLTPGVYPVNGSGLTANNGNYVFVQAPGNATAFTVAGAAQNVQLDAVRSQRLAQCDGEQGLADPLASLPCRVPADDGGPLPSATATPWLAVQGGGVRLPEGVQ